jgi:hypothetical protein
MFDIDKLKILTPLSGDEVSRETEYVNVSVYKYFRITSYSDIDLQLDIIFSFDGQNEGPVQINPLNHKWTTRKVEIILPYVKLRVTRAVAEIQENKLLVVNILARSQSDESKKEEEHIDHVEQVKPVEPVRSKSPFSSILKRGRSNSRSESKHEQPRSDKIQVHDSRIPEFLPRNAILVGGYSNSATIIPAPIDNDSVLVFSSGKFVWMPLLDPQTQSKSVKFTDIYN